jgi:hypothetical protein
VVEVRFYQVVIDCADPRSLAAFWRSFTGYEVSRDFDDWSSIKAPDGSARIGSRRSPRARS